MQSHTLTVLGLDISFKAKADPDRVNKACALLEERYSKLLEAGSHLSKEKILTFIALGLADDVLLLEQEKETQAKKVTELLVKVEKAASQEER